MVRQGAAFRASTNRLGLVVVLGLALNLSSCVQEKPEMRRLGEAIPVGELQLRPTHTEVSTTQTAPGRNPSLLFVVFIRCTGGNRFDRMDLNRKFFDRQAIDLVDEAGRTYDFFSLGGGETYSDWAARFYVRTDSRGFRLRLNNIARQDGQPRLVEVLLGQ